MVTHAQRLREAGEAFAVATVVKIGGSTYRRPGARMLIDANGAHYGVISGGCLEEEVAQQALHVITQGTAALLAFDLTDDAPLLGFGTGCNGQVHVLIEPVPATDRDDPVHLVGTCIDRRQSGVLAQVISAPDGADLLGRKFLLLEDSTVLGDMDTHLSHPVRSVARSVLAHGHHKVEQITTANGTVELLYEVVHPPVKLVLFGAGYDVGPVALLAKTLGWSTTVVGRQAAPILAERFPMADTHIFLMHPRDASTYVPLDQRSAALIMNHQYARDKTLIGALLETPIRYIGALGPRDRTHRIKQELCEENPWITDDHLDRVYGPVGLDIGTETPEEIALSAIAEIQATFHGRIGGRLRDRRGAIHEPESALPAGACQPLSSR